MSHRSPLRAEPPRCATQLVALLLALTLGGCVAQDVEPEPLCARYVACIQARDARDGTLTETGSFADDGACWLDADNADHCTSACTGGLAWLAMNEPDLGCD